MLSTITFIVDPHEVLLSQKVKKIIAEAGISIDDVIYATSPEDLLAVPLWIENPVVVFGTPDPATVKSLVEYCKSPDPDRFVIVGSTKPSAPLKKAVIDGGGVVVENAQRSQDIISQLLRGSGLTLTSEAMNFIVSQVGDDVEVIPSLVETLSTSFERGVPISVDDVAPWISLGKTQIWKLTDFIDSGDIAESIKTIERIWGSTSAVAIIGILKSHYEKVFLLHHMNPKSEVEAASMLNMKGSTYPAKKSMGLARRFGARSEAILTLILKAELDVKGKSGVPPKITIEVLVARICTLTRG